MPSGKLQAFLFGQSNQLARFGLVKDERLFDVNVATALEAKLGKGKVAFGRRRNVDDIGLGRAQQLIDIAEKLLDRKALEKLASHQRLTVAHRDDFAPLDSL